MKFDVSTTREKLLLFSRKGFAFSEDDHQGLNRSGKIHERKLFKRGAMFLLTHGRFQVMRWQ
jgi:hypothetical protein